MGDMNRVFLMGRLTRDPEIKYTGGGLAICEIGLAVNSKRKSGDDWVEEVTFIDVTVFGRQAETSNEYLAKGRQVLIEGRLKLDQWEKDGQKRSKLSVVAERVNFIGGRDDAGTLGDRTTGPPPAGASGGDDRVPF